MAFHERENDAILWGEEHGSNGGATASPKGLQYYESAVSYGSSYSSWSDLSSPFGSELESTSETTESEEDEEFISELTRRMAESMLQDDDEEEGDEPQQQLVQDPEASLLPVNWSGSGSKAGSVCFSYGFMPKSEKPCVQTAPNVNSVENLADEQLGPLHVSELKKQQGGDGGGGAAVMAADTAALLQREKQSTQNRGGGVGGRGWKHGGGQGKKNNIPMFPAGSGMRAVFLGGSDRTGCSGTGVFLPNGGGYSKPEPKRKSGCSTVLIPARVLQTLQQHFNTVGAPSPSNVAAGGGASAGGGGTPDLPWRNDVLARINGLLSQKKEHAEFHPRPRPPATYAAAVETSLHPVVPDLPQEWTY